MSVFTDSFLSRRREQFKRSLVKVEIQANGSWHTGKINKKVINGNSVQIYATFPDIDALAATVTASRIIDNCGEQVAYKQKNIKKVANQGFLIKIDIPIYEIS